LDTLDYIDYFSGNPYNSNPNYIRPRLIVESNSVEPDFKIMLYPFVENQELPITNWNDTKDTLETIFGDTDYTFAFIKNGMGRTEIETVEEVITSRPFISNINIDVFPNPTSEFIFVEHQLTNPLNILIYDATGQVILTKNITTDREEISLKKYAGGVYWYEIQTNGITIKSGKLVKLRKD